MFYSQSNPALVPNGVSAPVHSSSLPSSLPAQPVYNARPSPALNTIRILHNTVKDDSHPSTSHVQSRPLQHFCFSPVSVTPVPPETSGESARIEDGATRADLGDTDAVHCDSATVNLEHDGSPKTETQMFWHHRPV
ncbi:hypothetical protein HGRIS_007613 [Hohenbuehelia grisea]|uniref:Uncharacterized protein n=1 Tax=Hohenbuehelia grisea TaxID=104357 RepID=A0ABR3J5D2_9AGAR